MRGGFYQRILLNQTVCVCVREREKEQEGISQGSVVSMATHLDEGWYDSVNGSADDLEGILVVLSQ